MEYFYAKLVVWGSSTTMPKLHTSIGKAVRAAKKEIKLNPIRYRTHQIVINKIDTVTEMIYTNIKWSK